jgi:hypothetical protein
MESDMKFNREKYREACHLEREIEDRLTPFVRELVTLFDWKLRKHSDGLFTLSDVSTGSPTRTVYEVDAGEWRVVRVSLLEAVSKLIARVEHDHRFYSFLAPALATLQIEYAPVIAALVESDSAMPPRDPQFSKFLDSLNAT